MTRTTQGVTQPH